MPIRDFRDLEVWDKSMDLAVDVYSLTRTFPPSEQFALTLQLRKAASSTSTNIAEGSGRGTTRDLINFLTVSRASTRETQSLSILSNRLELIDPSNLDRVFSRCDSIVQMLNRLRSNLRAR